MRKAAYGRQLAEALHVGEAQTLVTRPILQESGIAVTEVRRDVPENDYTSAVPHDNAFLVTLNIRDWPKRVLWIDDKPVSALPIAAGSSNIFDLRRKYIGYGVSSFHMMSFYLPRGILNTVAQLDDGRAIDEFAHDPCRGIDDLVIRNLGLSLYPAFQRPGEANQLFIDHVTTAIAAHVLHAYGPKADKQQANELRLAKWHEARVKDVICAHLDGNMTVAQLARECGMPLRAFSAAFERSVGMPPHQWLLNRRLEKAMTMLKRTAAPIGEIATLCGFAGERHLVRVFSRIVGASPQKWRTAYLS
ncbi:helix-turn-helix transcriptional regulator [Bradyrhizobium sp. Arg62]|uniref:helix-turn-helix domain-containing protein n=1 Tax=Bradyrhizobium brasilense TaxID=1419277 RepID=UPI001E500C50|nr:AraC family transcriptional regulator [Bradyrhizobium brasilense]MCC8943546.1 helix-turn-helix transcriptional regulator [Bradyrhizobium brasilense]